MSIRSRLVAITATLTLLVTGGDPRLRAVPARINVPARPEPDNRNVIVQLFNWPFRAITTAMPQLRAAGYSYVLVSPPQRSNEHVREWWGRYQPIDFSVIDGPLGTEAEFRTMNVEADRRGIQILVDVVGNHTIDITEMPSSDFVRLRGDEIVGERFPQFDPGDFHRRCAVDDQNPPSLTQCWLSNNLCDLKTETSKVRAVLHRYLLKLVSLGVDGFRFDAAKHIDPAFFAEVLRDLPNAYAFGEVITSSARSMPRIDALDFYDFPLAATLKRALAFGGDLQALRDPAAHDGALEGSKAVTFVRNHDIDRGQANDRGLDAGSLNTFGVGWNGPDQPLTESDIVLAYAYILGREDGLPYVFADMPNPGVRDKRKDAFDDERIVAFIRFHNLSLAGQGGIARRPEIWRDTGSPNALAWQRGTDRLVIINKAAEPLVVRNLATTLVPGRYIEVRTASPLDVGDDGRIREWIVPGQTAVMFVKE
jgi:alpha-amylase